MLLCTELSVLLFGICFGKFVGKRWFVHSFDRSVGQYRSRPCQASIGPNDENPHHFLSLRFDLHGHRGRRVRVRDEPHFPLSLKAVLEFRDDTRPIQLNTSNYNLYSYGGMKFLLISSSMFLLVISLRSSKASLVVYAS